MKSSLSSSRGAILPLVMLIMLVVGILSVGVWRMTRSLVGESVYQAGLAQARVVAEAGLEDALLQIRLTPGWNAGFTNKSFGDGRYSVTVSSDAQPWVTSRGESSSISAIGRPHATVRAQAVGAGSAVSDDCTTFAKSDVSIKGRIDAYDSSVSVNPTKFSAGGHFCANAKFTVTNLGTPSVLMDVEYYSNPAPLSSTITGTIKKSTFTRTWPAHDGSPYVNNNRNATLPSAYYTSSTKALSISNGKSVTMYPGIYYLNSLSVSGNLRIDASTGPVILYLNNSFTLSNRSGTGNGEITSVTRVPSDFTIYLQGSRTITLQSKAPVYAVIDGPASSVIITQVFYGNIIGNAVSVNSGNYFHFDKQTSPASTSASTTHVQWKAGTWSVTP